LDSSLVSQEPVQSVQPMGCNSSSASTNDEIGIGSNEVLIDVKVAAAMPGGEENTWQVRLERGATMADIKRHICELYDMPVQMQVLRRSPDSDPLGDEERLGQEKRVTMHLSTRNPLQDLVSALTGGTVPSGGQPQGANPMDLLGALTGGGGQAPGANPFAALTEQMSSAMAEMNAIQESLAETDYSLKFVMPAQSSREKEKRCSMKVAATAMVNDVLDMVKLELNVESKRLALEFAGRALPAAAKIHICGLSDDDTVMVVPAA